MNRRSREAPLVSEEDGLGDGTSLENEGQNESTAEERALLIVRMAVRAFGNGDAAGEWLAEPNRFFDSRPPLAVARESVAGCSCVCGLLDKLGHHVAV